MTKIIAWIILVIVVLFALRLINQNKARARRKKAAAATTAESSAATTPMVRCTRCGVFMPRTDARLLSGEYVCPDNACAHPQ